MPVLPPVCARAGKALCQEVWHCLTGESPSWDHLDIGTSPIRIVQKGIAVLADTRQRQVLAAHLTGV